MGWTHYWSRPTKLPPEDFTRAVADCSRLLGQVGIPLAGPAGTGRPAFGPNEVAFNGVAPDAGEPFEIHQTEFDRHGRPTVRSFCKTGNAPYDLAVRIALIVLKEQLGVAFSVKSDASHVSWDAARRVCQDTLGYGDTFTLDQT
jgi:hypothetical protein